MFHQMTRKTRTPVLDSFNYWQAIKLTMAATSFSNSNAHLKAQIPLLQQILQAAFLDTHILHLQESARRTPRENCSRMLLS